MSVLVNVKAESWYLESEATNCYPPHAVVCSSEAQKACMQPSQKRLDLWQPMQPNLCHAAFLDSVQARSSLTVQTPGLPLSGSQV